MLRLLIIAGTLFLSSCSPFGDQSLIEGISTAIARLFKGEAPQAVVSGSTQVMETNPGLPAQNYKVSTSVGAAFEQNTLQTNDGYTVQTSIQ